MEHPIEFHGHPSNKKTNDHPFLWGFPWGGTTSIPLVPGLVNIRKAIEAMAIYSEFSH